MKKMFYLIGSFLLIIIVLFVFYNFNKNKTITISDNVVKYNFDNKEYYIINGDYKGEYNVQYTDFNYDEEVPSDFNITKVLNYEEYTNYVDKFNIDKVYRDKNKNYIVISYCSIGSPYIKVRIADVETKDNKSRVYIWEHTNGFTADAAAYVAVIPVDKSVTNLDITLLYTNEEFNNIKKYGNADGPYSGSIDKPIIYLYPTKDTNVSVKLLNDKLITHSYPKYENEWNVLAKSNGDLVDLKTNRNLYALYYENKNIIDFNTDDGFVVKGEDTIKFLEEKLEILGLNEKESEEFIIYWLPKLENNKYNYIRFATMDEINENMPLEINPKPDTIIRILMTYKPLEDKIDIKEQKLNKALRNGYTVVEWGGTKLN